MLGSDQIGIVMEYLSGGSLNKLYKKLSKDKESDINFPLVSRLELAEQILYTLREMKEQSEEEVPMFFSAPEIIRNTPINASAAYIYLYLMAKDLNFPKSTLLRSLLSFKGSFEWEWSRDPEERPKLSEFREIIATQLSKVGIQSKLTQKHGLNFQGGTVEKVSIADPSSEVSDLLVDVLKIGLRCKSDLDST
ncbi:hypothetical protein M0813_05027 [Anaeramoeba flamelloides]|uniref:Protein kinase domain-containing protein n=1 Tax=Anaeramoeba flamelloides TaxID=1746091 RepID=A0ABQ8XI24_9EUKA|nr:hypothetical protein M0813_05027 [Anaeramoeba flamelloides]